MEWIRDAVFARMDELTRAEKKVARTLLANYPSAGLASAAALAKAAGTSTPTVLRLASRIGIGNYPDFQEQLRREITQRMNSPVSRAANRLHGDGELDPVAALGRSAARAGGATDRGCPTQ